MAKCAMTGKRALKGNSVSHANNRTRKWQKPNIQKKKIWVPELNKSVCLSLSTRAIKTLNKIGLMEYARKNNIAKLD